MSRSGEVTSSAVQADRTRARWTSLRVLRLASAFYLASALGVVCAQETEDTTVPTAQPDRQADGQSNAEADREGKPALPEPPGANADPNGPPPMQVLVLVTSTTGIDPVVGQHVTTQVKNTLVQMRYDVLDDAIVADAVARSRMVYPPAPADLWRATHAAQAHRGVFARAWAEGGKYVAEVTVASADGAGPFFARGAFSADQLLDGVDGLLKQAMPALGVWQVSATQNAIGLPADPNQPGGAPTTLGTRPPIRPDPPIKHRVRIALQTEAAFGVGDAFFYNHLLGVKADVKVGHTVLLGASLAYANLEGANGRVGNLLPSLFVENRIRIGRPVLFSIPLRIQGGYLPRNGPVFRFSAGLNFPLSERVELGVDLVAPTFWVLPERTAFSFNVGTELGYRF